MTQEEIITQLREIMKESSEADVDWDGVDADASIASLGFDSLSLLDLIYDIQQAFDVEFDAESLASVKTVGELAAFLEAKLS